MEAENNGLQAKRIEGLWDCEFCGQKAIRARFSVCPGCGSPRGASTLFYLPTDQEAFVLSRQEAAKTSNAPDWLCDYCGSLNSADETSCRGCGSPRKESRQNYGTLHASTGRQTDGGSHG